MTFDQVITSIRATARTHGKTEALACIAMIRRCRDLPGEPSLTAEERGALTVLEAEIGGGKR